MQLDRIFISSELPRDIDSFNASFHEGLYSYKWFGSFFLLGGIFFLAICIWKVRIFYPYIMVILIIGIGFLIRRHAFQIAETRKSCFLNGTLVKAKVLKHQRTFNPFKSNRDYSLLLSFENETGKEVQKTVSHKHEKIWTTNPVNAEIIGLVYGEYSFFGEEIGVTFKLFNKD